MSETDNTQLQLQTTTASKQFPTLTKFKPHNHSHLHTTTVYLLHPPNSLSSTTAATPWIVAAIDGGDKLQLRHPVTLSHQLWHHLPDDFSLSKLNSTTLVVSYHTSNSFDKLLVVNDDLDECTLLGLYDGGKLDGLSMLFDDIVVFRGKICGLNREGRLYLINNCENTGEISIGETLIDNGVGFGGEFGWRKRLVVDGNQLYLVARKAEELLEVYEFNVGNEVKWEKVEGFVHSQVLFMSRDYCFFWRSKFPGREYKNCIVFSEGAFPRYGDDCWEFSRFSGDGIAVFRLGDGTFARECDNEEFPKFNWSPPPWVFDAWSGLANESQSHSSSDCYSLSERESHEDEDLNSNGGDEKEGDVQLDFLKDSDSKDERDEEMQSDLIGEGKEQERMESDLDSKHQDGMKYDPDSQEKKDEVMHCNANIETGTSLQEDVSHSEFERFDIRSDLVPILQKIWLKHGNIILHSTIRGDDIITRALESLAMMVQILEDNSAQSLSDSQADYLSSTLSDLRCICFKVCWLIPFVEKAVQLHKSKPLLESLKNLRQLLSQVKERKAILSEELTKLEEEENKLKEEMTAVSKKIPFSGQVKFDELLGLGLT